LLMMEAALLFEPNTSTFILVKKIRKY